MNPEMLFSVIIPTYNRSGYIGKTVQTVLSQQYEYFEVIIVDDGSTDNTESIIAKWEDKRIQYFKKSNEERAAARNYGIKKARGEYVTFLDSDDLLMPHHLSEACAFIAKRQDVAIFHQGYDVVDENGVTIYPWKALPDPVNNKLLEGNFLSCLGVFVKRSILMNNMFNEDRALSGSEDYELWMRLAARFPIYTNPTVTAKIVNHDSRSVLNVDPEKFIRRITLAQDYLMNNPNVKATFGIRARKIKAYLNVYAALHLAMISEFGKGWNYLLRSILQWPFVIINYRFLVVVKKLIF